MRRHLPMALPTYSTSVVIPTYNGRLLLEQNLPAIVTAAMGAEIIVVDDASTDQTSEWLADHYPEIKVVKYKVNRRFAAACNGGVAAAKGQIVILLNNDVCPKPDFLELLLAPFSDPQVFAVGSKEIDEVGGQIIEQGRTAGTFDRGLIIHWRAKNQLKRETLWVMGGSGAFRKSMWQELKGMDELFAPAYEEDRDISYRALKRGWKLVFEPLSIVYHHHESTNQAALGKLPMKISSYKNQLLFIWKNITQTELWHQHLIWLPYHLLITTIKSKGLFLLGFIWALWFTPRVIHLRTIERMESTVEDQAILQPFKNE
jgi:O-antigen biosynthesis protein